MATYFRRAKRAVKRAYNSKAGKAIRKVTRQRYGTWRKPNVGQLVKDVSLLKNMVNAEKKRTDIASVSAATQLGQYAWNGTVNSNAYFHLDITPTPTQGVTYSTRSGASIKLSTSYMQFMLYQQSATAHPMKFIFEIFEYFGGYEVTNANQAFKIFAANQWIANEQSGTAIIDYNSERQPDYFSQYKCLYRKVVSMAPDSTSSMTSIKNVKIPIRWGKNGRHIRFNGDAGTTVTAGQLILFIRCDSGNAGATAGGLTTACPVSAANTGAQLQYDIKHYYYDN